MPLYLLLEDWDKKLRFLTSFELGHEDGVGGTWRNVWSVKRLYRARHRTILEKSRNIEP